MFFLNSLNRRPRTSFCWNLRSLSLVYICSLFFGAQESFARSVGADVQHEFLIKTSSRSAAAAFSLSSGWILASTPLLETPEGDWFKVIHYGKNTTFEKLQNQLSAADGLIAFENNLKWFSVGKSSTAPNDEEPAGPSPSSPPRLPRRERKDPLLEKVWSLEKVNAADAWKHASGSYDVVVANIDSGVDYNHQDLINSIWRNSKEVPNDGIDNDGNGFVDDVIGWDFANGDSRPWDDNGHGSHTAGTIGATGGNGIGLSGVAKKVSIMPLKFLSSFGEGTTEDAVLAIRYAVRSGARILSNSWGGETFSQALEDAIAYAGQHDVLFVAAAGNDSSDNDALPMYPASYDLPNVLSVAATDRIDQLADFSNYGYSTVHLAAPGDFIWSTTPNNKYSVMSGTSMACPLVAGAAALLKSFRPTLNVYEIKDLLLASSDKLPELLNKVRSSGRLNVAKALNRSLGSF